MRILSLCALVALVASAACGSGDKATASRDGGVAATDAVPAGSDGRGDASSTCTQARYVSGSISSPSVAPNGTFTVSCNYGPSVVGSGSVKVSVASCAWSQWAGNDAQFTCTASGTPGSYPVSCQLVDMSTPPVDDFCALTNSVGSVTVTGTAPSEGMPAAKAALLAYFDKVVADKEMLAGQHWNGTTAPTSTIDSLFNETGKKPAIFGVPFSWYVEMDGVGMAQAFAQSGGIVFAGSWFYNPWTGGYEDDTNIPGSFSDVVTTGSTAYDNFIAELDSDAAKIQQLQAAGIVVMYRPFIEISGGWFWWGNRDPATFVKLWRMTHDYMVETKGLQNIVWVYNLAAGYGNQNTYYAGGSYVDVVSTDYYGSNPAGDMASDITALSALGKPILVAEFGCITSDYTAIQPFTCDNDQLFTQIHQAFPQVFGVAVWGQGWAIDQQNGAAALMGEPWLVDLAKLPTGI